MNLENIMLSDMKVKVVNCSVMSNSVRPHELKPGSLSVHRILQARILEWVFTILLDCAGLTVLGTLQALITYLVKLNLRSRKGYFQG